MSDPLRLPNRLGASMRRRLLILFVALTVLATGGAFLWSFLQKPETIPYDAWITRRDRSFPLARTEPNNVAIRNDDLLNADDFVFAMGVGSGMHGLHVFQVDASGSASYVFSTGRDRWWKQDFRIPSEQVVNLRQLLIEVDCGSMARAYHADVIDGWQWCIRIDVNGTTKKVYCNNFFPEAVQRLADFVRTDMLLRHDGELRSARRIHHSSAMKIAAPLWQ